MFPPLVNLLSAVLSANGQSKRNACFHASDDHTIIAGLDNDEASVFGNFSCYFRLTYAGCTIPEDESDWTATSAGIPLSLGVLLQG